MAWFNDALFTGAGTCGITKAIVTEDVDMDDANYIEADFERSSKPGGGVATWWDCHHQKAKQHKANMSNTMKPLTRPAMRVILVPESPLSAKR